MSALFYKRVSTVILISVLGILKLNAQGCCSGGTPISNHLNLTDSNKGNIVLRLTYDYNHLNDLINGNEKILNDNRKRITHTALAKIDYSFSNRFSIGVLIPWIQQVESISSVNGFDRITRGVGDISILGQATIFKKSNHGIHFAGGLKMPNGNTDRTDQNINLTYHPDLQPGSGTWDILGILQYNWMDVFTSGIDLFTNLNFRYVGSQQRFGNNQNYKFGDIWQSELVFSKNYFIKNLMMASSAGIQYRYFLKDKINGFNAPNTGGMWSYLLIDQSFVLTPDFQFRIGTELPVFRNVSGLQLTTSFRLKFVLQYSFSILKKNDDEIINNIKF